MVSKLKETDQQKCQICLANDSKLLSLFEQIQTGEYEQFTDILLKYYKIEVSAESGKLQNICEKCINNVKILAEFNIKFRKTEEVLNQEISNNIKNGIKLNLERCRFCLTEENLFPLHKKTRLIQDALDTITTIFETQMSPYDNKLQKICAECVDTSKVLRKFMRECKEDNQVSNDLKATTVTLNLQVGNKIITQETKELTKNKKTLEEHDPKSSACEICKIDFISRFKFEDHFMKKHKLKKDIMEDSNIIEIIDDEDTVESQHLMKEIPNNIMKKETSLIFEEDANQLNNSYSVEYKNFKVNSVSIEISDNSNDNIDELTFTNLKNEIDLIEIEKTKIISVNKEILERCRKKKDSNVSKYLKKSGESVEVEEKEESNDEKEISSIETKVENRKTKEVAKSKKLIPKNQKNDLKKPKSCQFCGFKWSFPMEFNKHVTEEHPEKGLQCEICGKIFLSRAQLKRHLHRHDANYKFKCEICKGSFKCSSSLRVHQKNVHKGVKPHKCNTCGKRFLSKKELKCHKDIHNQTFTCIECLAIFLTLTDLREHYLGKHRYTTRRTNNLMKSLIRTSKHDITEEILISVDNFDNHMEVELNENLEEQEENGLNVHNEIKNKSKKGMQKICSICGILLKSKKQEEIHTLKHLTNKKCRFCDYKWTTTLNLNNHITLMHADKGHKCQICNQVFLAKGNLMAHLKRHKYKEFPCEICNKVLRCVSSLREHETKIHGDVKPYICNICGERFKKSKKLREHKCDSHADNKPLCEICKFVFPKLSDLEIHLFKKHLFDLNKIKELLKQQENKLNKFVEKNLEKLKGENNNLKNVNSLKGLNTVNNQIPISKEEKKLQNIEKSKGNFIEAGPNCSKISSQLKNSNKIILTFTQKMTQAEITPENISKPNYQNTLDICDVCGFVAGSRRKLTGHKESHRKCIYCDFTFTIISRTNLDKHVTEKHPERLELLKIRAELKETCHKCPICLKVFERKEMLNSHKLKHLKKTLYECEICEISFVHAVNLVKHNLQMHSDEINKGQRSKANSSNDDLIQSSPILFKNLLTDNLNNLMKEKNELGIKTETDVNKLEGEESLNKYSTSTFNEESESLDTKKKKTINITNHLNKTCQFCTFTCINLSDLEKHNSEKHSEFIHKCTICKFVFLRKLDLTLHTRRLHHEKLKCPDCNLKFYSLNTLKSHLESTHSGEKRFACVQCGQRFESWIALKAHNNSHATKLSCQICNINFQNFHDLGKHFYNVHKSSSLHYEELKKQHLTLLDHSYFRIIEEDAYINSSLTLPHDFANNLMNTRKDEQQEYLNKDLSHLKYQTNESKFAMKNEEEDINNRDASNLFDEYILNNIKVEREEDLIEIEETKILMTPNEKIKLEFEEDEFSLSTPKQPDIISSRKKIKLGVSETKINQVDVFKATLTKAMLDIKEEKKREGMKKYMENSLR